MADHSKDKQTWQETDALRSRGDAVFIAMHNNSSAFAQLSLRSALLLNGGALFALPAFFASMKTTAEIQKVVPDILWAAQLFVVGILLAALSSFIGYVSYQLFAEIHLGEGGLAAVKVEEREDPEASNAMRKARTDYFEEVKPWISRRQTGNFIASWAAVICGLSSYVFFCWACYVSGGALILPVAKAAAN